MPIRKPSAPGEGRPPEARGAKILRSYPPLIKFALTRHRGLRNFAIPMLVVLSQIVMLMGFLRQWYALRTESLPTSGAARPRRTRPSSSAGEAA